MTNSKAVAVLQPHKPQSEGHSAYDLQDSQGKYIMHEIIGLAHSKKAEGFTEYFFSKPSDKNNEYRKLSFVKAFKKLDLIIVMGDYIEDYKVDVKNKMLKQFPKLQFQEGGHIYIITFDGDIISHPSDKAINTNIFKEDKYNHMDYLFKDLILKEEKDSAVFMNIKPKVVESVNTKDTKVNYVKRFDEWKWMIGLNFNISDANPIIKKRKDILEKKYDNYKKDILFYGVLFTLIMLILSYFMSKILERKFLLYKENLETKNKKLKSQSILLEQKKDELETIITEAPNPIMIHNEDGKVMMINQAWIESSGYTLNNTPTIEDWVEYVYKDEKIRITTKEHIYSLYEITEKINEGEFVFTNKNGNLVSWQFYSAPLGVIDGKRTVISSAMDITELERTKDKETKSNNELLKSNEKFNRFFQLSINLQLIFTTDGIMQEVNSACKSILGYEMNEMLGKQFLDLHHPDDVEPTIKEMSKLSRGENVHNFENRYIHKDGHYVNLLWTATTDLTNNLIYATAQDITILKKIEREEKEKDKLLKKSEKLASMGDMIANIAHQWRQPLSVISTASTGMLAQKEYDLLSDENLIKSCNSINNNAQYLSKTIDDFRNFIKNDNTTKVFNLTESITSFLHLVEGTAKNNDIRIILDLEDNINIDGFENNLAQCLINIFGNAKDALVEHNIDNKLIFIDTKLDIDKVIIRIKDNAGGIPINVLPKIFEPYFTTKHESQGTGLGLHMTYNLIADGMNGHIEADNVDYIYDEKVYLGAEFVITLPME